MSTGKKATRSTSDNMLGHAETPDNSPKSPSGSLASSGAWPVADFNGQLCKDLLLASSANARYVMLLEFIQAKLAERVDLNALSSPRASLEDRELVELGVTSATAVEYKNFLSTQLRLSLPTLLFFESSNLKEVAMRVSQAFADQHLGGKAFLPAEEVEQAIELFGTARAGGDPSQRSARSVSDPRLRMRHIHSSPSMHALRSSRERKGSSRDLASPIGSPTRTLERSDPLSQSASPLSPSASPVPSPKREGSFTYNRILGNSDSPGWNSPVRSPPHTPPSDSESSPEMPPLRLHDSFSGSGPLSPKDEKKRNKGSKLRLERERQEKALHELLGRKSNFEGDKKLIKDVERLRRALERIKKKEEKVAA